MLQVQNIIIIMNTDIFQRKLDENEGNERKDGDK